MGDWSLQNVVFVSCVVTGTAISVLCALVLANTTVKEPSLSGRPPTTVLGFQRAIERLKALKRAFVGQWLANTALVGIFGVAIPSVMFFLTCLNASSLLQSIPFVSSADGYRLANEPTDVQLLDYVVSSTENSLSFGFFETAHWPTSEITHDAKNPLVFATVWGFRAILDFFGVGWVFAGLLGAFGGSRIQRRINQYEFELMNLIKESAPPPTVSLAQTTVLLAA